MGFVASALTSLRHAAFVFASALTTVTASEWMYWYYTDATPDVFLGLALFYSLSIYAVLWFVHRYHVDDVTSLVLAVPIYAYVTEGVITPILYSGGPVPFFPLWFSAWHGGLGVLVLWYLLRRLLVADRALAVLAVAAGLGLFWGTWATTMWLPENLDDPDLAESAPHIRTVVDFARYATIVTAVLAAAHLALGRGLWVANHQPSRVVTALLAGASLIVVAAYSAVFVWALPMMAALLAPTAWLLRRHRAARAADDDDRAGERPPILAQLAGPVRLRTLAPLVALPATASVTYAAWTAVDPGDDVVRVIMYGTIGLQTVAAAVVLWVAARRVIRASPGTGGVRSGRWPGRRRLRPPGARPPTDSVATSSGSAP